MIILQFLQEDTWDDVLAAFEQQRELARQINRPVAVLIDVRLAPNPPDNSVLTRVNSLFKNQPPNVRVVVLCGGSRFSQVMVSIVRNAGIMNMHAASTLDESFSLAEQKLKA